MARRPRNLGRSLTGVCGLAALMLALSACGGSSAESPDEGQDAAAAPAATDTTRSTSAAITITLQEENASGQSGTATLRRAENEFDVEIEMTPPVRFPGENQNAHIHKVTCAEYRRMNDYDEQLATVVDWLPNLGDGRAEGSVGVPLAERTTGTYAINVHEQDDPYTVVACGDIPKR